MPQEINNVNIEKPEIRGKIEERDEKGRYIKGKEKTGGKEKGTISITSAFKRKLQQISKEKGKENLAEFIETIWNMATKDRNEAMIKLICNYVEGMPKQALDISGQIEEKQIRELVLTTRKILELKETNEPNLPISSESL